MDGSLYDEFGNFIGELSDSDSSDSEIEYNEAEEDSDIDDFTQQLKDNEEKSEKLNDTNDEDDDVNNGMAVVLHEDKEYYKSAEEVFGNVNTLVMDEDAMRLDEPLINPNIEKKFTKEEIFREIEDNRHPDLTFSTKYIMDNIIDDPEMKRVRNIALIGHLGHGKTHFMDILLKDVLVSEQNIEESYNDEDLNKYEKNKMKKKKQKQRRNRLINNKRNNFNVAEEDGMRYTDLRNDEQERKISIKSTPTSLLLNTSFKTTRSRGTLYENRHEVSGYGGTPYLLNIIDCPGHPNFSDECIAALQISDGFVIVVDVCEGVMLQTKRLIKAAMMQGGHSLTPVLVLNKMDRLILELRIPPQDAYYKCLYIIEEINEIIATYAIESFTLDELNEKNRFYKNKNENKSENENGIEDENEELKPKSFLQRLSPDLGNVCFASSRHGWIFTLFSFAEMYKNTLEQTNKIKKVKTTLFSIPFDSNQLAIRLWGESYFDKEERQFKKTKISSSSKVSFVEFILEPLYKLYGQVLGEDRKILKKTLKELNLMANPSLPYGIHEDELALDVKPLLTLVISKFLGSGGNKTGNSSTGAFVDMIKEFIPSPLENAPAKIERIWKGNQGSKLSKMMKLCDPEGDLMINVVKMYLSSNNTFTALGRIYSGTLRIGDQCRVLGENYSNRTNEDVSIEQISSLLLPIGRIRLEIGHVTAGNIILIEGVSDSINKTATLTYVPERTKEYVTLTDIECFHSLQFIDSPVMKIAVEPLIPSELPKMIEGLRSVKKTYPVAKTKMEDSGEHVIYGTGELFLDSVLHDIREIYSNIELKVSDPIVSFAETVVEMSAIQCFSDTPNKRNRFTMIAEPLEAGIADDIESKKINFDWDKKIFGNYLQETYDWDFMASRSVWAFGPETNGPNVLLNDTLSEDINKRLLDSVKDNIVQGFVWACREGPLCHEPIRNTKFRLLDANISDQAIYRGGSQILSTARRVVYSSFLMATPRLMEPIYKVQIQVPSNIVSSVYRVVKQRRGHVYQNHPQAGTPFHLLNAYIPVIDSFGFETDLRSYTHGQAFCLQVFDHWEIVPGDPLDKDIILHPLQPSPNHHLARDFMIKTRRRKGLTDDISVTHYFGEEMIREMAAVQEDL